MLTRVLLAGSIVVAAVALVGIGAYLYLPQIRGVETTDDAYVDGHVVNAAPQAAGRVSEVLVDDNQEVEKDQILLRIDPSDYQARLAQAQGARSQAEGQLRQANAQLEVARASAAQLHSQIKVAQANAKKALADLHRYQSLSGEAISKITLDTAETTVESTAAQSEAAAESAAGADAQVELAATAISTARANLQAAQAAEALARLNLSYCELRAPMAGFITRKTVETGNYVNIGQPLMIIVPRNVYVTANFKETQLARMRVGQSVSVAIDAYPGLRFTGHIDSLMAGTGSAFALLPPENATGNFVKVVQRTPVKIVLDGHNDDPTHRLAPGMSAEPSVFLKNASKQG